MFKKTGGKAFGYATLLAVIFMLSACGPGTTDRASNNTGNGDGGVTDDSTTNGGDGGVCPGQKDGKIDPNIVVTFLTYDLKGSTVTLSGTLVGGNLAMGIMGNCVGRTGTKRGGSPPDANFQFSVDNLDEDADYTCTVTPLTCKENPGVGKSVAFHTEKMTIDDPEWALAKVVFNGSIWRVADQNNQNTNPIQTTQLSETTDPSCNTGKQVSFTVSGGETKSSCFDPKTWDAWTEENGYRTDYKADFCNNVSLIAHYGEQVRAIAEAHASTANGCYDQWNHSQGIAEFIWRITQVDVNGTYKTDLLKYP